MATERIRLWDLPTRVFHWSLATLVLVAIVTGKVGGNAMVWHGRIGIAIVGLLAFRLIWGFIGSTYARFAQFLPTHKTVLAYLNGNWQGVGHNPLGALSTCTFFAVIAALLVTGLVGNDDIAFRGPLFDLAGKALSDTLIGIHRQITNLLIALIVLHIAAIAFHTHAKKDNLIRPMLTGWKELPVKTAQSARGGGTPALIAALLIALGAMYGASGAWLPTPPPAAPQATPDW